MASIGKTAQILRQLVASRLIIIGIDFTSTLAGLQFLVRTSQGGTIFMFIGDLEHFGLFNYNYLGRSSLLNGAILDVKTTMLGTK